LFIGFVMLNVAFAAALIVFVSRTGGKPTPASPMILNVTGSPSNPPLAISVQPPPTPSSGPAQPSTSAPPATATARPASPAPVPSSSGPGRTHGWEDIETSSYQAYLADLRNVGCPEKTVRQIILNDANELFNQRRLQAAITNDFKWWLTDNQLSAGGYNPEFQARMQTLVQERRELLTRLLGSNWEEEDKTPSIVNHTVALTGPVLGALPPETYIAVQEICARSVSRHQDYLMGRFNEGQASSQIELAKLRDQTRKDLATVLDKDQLEEFLLRFSHNSSKLRQDFRGVGLSPDEFRKVFRATDQIDHQIQLEYGGEEALSPKQREQLARQREQALASILGPDRYTRLVLGKDPLYRQAQRLVMESGAPDSATQPLYDLLKSGQSRRQQIQMSRTMTPEQKQDAMVALNQELLKQQKQLLQEK
jgi:hypothetical protein